jgi:hypothetical protein
MFLRPQVANQSYRRRRRQLLLLDDADASTADNDDDTVDFLECFAALNPAHQPERALRQACQITGYCRLYLFTHI